MTTTVPTANAEYEQLMDPQTPAPTPPVHAARLSALLKSLASAEGAVSESIKARGDLIGGLEKLLENNRTALIADKAQVQELTARKTTVEAKKREVEDGIMRGLSAESSKPANQGDSVTVPQTNGHNSSVEPERPQMEELTPPPVESLTPVGSSPLVIGADAVFEHQSDHTEPAPYSQPAAYSITAPAGADLLSSLSMPSVRPYGEDPTDGGTAKKRKIETDFEDFIDGDAMADLDEDVAELLRAESGGR